MPYRVLSAEFFARDCLQAAPELTGKYLCRRLPDGTVLSLQILETEAYRGEEDTACHAHRGRTRRTEVLYGPPGVLYVYLCYGIHSLLNVITGKEEEPQGVLIRSCRGAEGPGKLTKALKIDSSLNRLSLSDPSAPVWFEDRGVPGTFTTAPRVGIGYASEADRLLPWRFILK